MLFFCNNSLLPPIFTFQPLSFIPTWLFAPAGYDGLSLCLNPQALNPLHQPSHPENDAYTFVIHCTPYLLVPISTIKNEAGRRHLLVGRPSGILLQVGKVDDTMVAVAVLFGVVEGAL